jgi:hypothetical protein
MVQATLDWLKGLGEGHGFTVGGFMGADQAWLIRDGEPVFTFIVDDGDGCRGFMETLGLYWGSADYLSKPLYHFLVLAGGALNAEQGAMMASLTSQYRVTVLVEPSAQELKGLVDAKVADLVKVMGRYCDGTVASLRRSVAAWADERPRVRASFHCGSEYDSGGLHIFVEGGSLQPSRRAVPCILEASGVTIESVLLRLVEAGGSLRFSSEHRNLPLTVDFTLGEGDSLLSLLYEPEKGSLAQAYEFEAFLASATDRGACKLLDSSGVLLIEFKLL